MPRGNKKKSTKKATSKSGKKSDKSTTKTRYLGTGDGLDEMGGSWQGIDATTSLRRDTIVHTVKDVCVDKFMLRFHGECLFEDTSLKLVYGRRYGLIGRNGCGKSTLLRAISHQLFPMSHWVTVFSVGAEIAPSDEETALEAVLKVQTRIDVIEEEIVALEEKLNNFSTGESDCSNEDIDTINAHLEELEEERSVLNPERQKAEACRILYGLQFTAEMQSRPTSSFSGGWRQRISLARALLMNPTLLLLDGPTCHLDMEAVVWLEGYLKKSKKTLLIVSHSQDFLNEVCTHIIRINEMKKLVYYSGNFDAYVTEKTRTTIAQTKQSKKISKEVEATKVFVNRFGSGSRASQATSRKKRLKKLGEIATEVVGSAPTLKMFFGSREKLPPPLLQFVNVSFRYDTGPMLYKGLDFGLTATSRVCLVGPNGCGKSTLLKLITDELTSTSGEIKRHIKLKIARYTQHLTDLLDPEMTPLEWLQSQYGDLGMEETRGILGRFGTSGPNQLKKICFLSGGQQARVLFAWLARKNCHLLLLDEPTNALDPETIDSLATAIREFGGGVVVVSHDMRLISAVNSEIWECTGPGTGRQTEDSIGGSVARFEGDIMDYKKRLIERLREEEEFQEQKRMLAELKISL